MAKKADQRKSVNTAFRESIGIIAVPMIVFAFILIQSRASAGTVILSFVIYLTLMSTYILFARPAFVRKVRDLSVGSSNLLSFPVALFVLIVAYAGVTLQLTFPGILYGLLYLLLPVLLIMSVRGKSPKLNILDALVIMVLWLPVEMDLLPAVNLPPGSGMSIFHLAGLLMLFYIYLVVRPLDQVGYTFKLKQKEWQTAVMTFLALLVVLVVLGMSLDFLSVSRRMPGLGTMLMQAVSIFFLVAIPEEMLFRGVIQNLLEKRLTGKSAGMVALVLASIIFGLAHINNVKGPVIMIGDATVPWAYLLMSTIAGLGYGYTWMKTRKIMAAALVHLLVDWTWLMVLNG